MRKKVSIGLFVLMSLTTGINATELKTQVEKESYSIGASTGSYISNQLFEQSQLGIKSDIDVVIKGLIDALKNDIKISDDEIINSLNDRAERLNKTREELLKKALEDNKKAGAKYLADNGKKKGVKKTKSGLQYEILKNAKGEKPQGESVVQLHYKAYLTDGTVFDDTYERNTPSYLTMFNLIDGLQEGLKLMNEGSKYKIVIPSDLAYGDDDVQAIPGGSTVIFEVELLKVYKPGELADDAKDKLTPQELMQMHGGMPSGH